MRVIGHIIKSKATAFTYGQTGRVILDSGSKIKWMARVVTYGQMVADTKARTSKIKEADSAFSPGLTKDNMKECGNTASNMEKVNINCQMV